MTNMSDAMRERIQSRIEELGATPRSISLAADLNAHYLQKFLSGKRASVSAANLQKIAEALNVSPEYLLEGRNKNRHEDQDLRVIVEMWEHIPSTERRSLRKFSESAAEEYVKAKSK